MKMFLKFVARLSLATHIIAGGALIFMMAVTLFEVIGRAFGKPIVGSYELISFSGGIVVGFAIPYTSWKRGHVYVDAVIDTLSRRNRLIVSASTRILGIALFILAGWNFISMGFDLYATKEVSATLRLPFYPIAYGIGVSCFIQCIMLAADIGKNVLRGQHE
jgi:TRAP-type C4-dicarboxylate transport system permease small subunit